MSSLRIKLLVVFVAALGMLGWWVYSSAGGPADHTGEEHVTITLTQSGFDPEQAYITRGTRVTFESAREGSFWPASDLHPAHLTYPAFDPRRPLSQAESWDFVFDKDGIWHFHDHIDPIAVGAVIVVPPGVSGEEAARAFIVCNQESLSERRSCWKKRMEDAFDKGGVDAAFEEIAKMYAEDEAFARDCHAFSHDLGLLAYRRYGDSVPPTHKMATCGQGFYHGYMEGFLFGNNGNMEEASRFCVQVGEHFKDVFPFAGPQCHHGMGHGQMEFLLSTNLDLMYDLPRLVGLGVTDCGVLPDADARFRCTSGVYAVTKDWVNIQKLTGEYPKLFSLDDPFALCKYLEEDWARGGCAWELSKQALIMAKLDPDIAFPAILAASKEWGSEYLELMIRSAAFHIGEFGVRKSDTDLAASCRSISDVSERAWCVEGIANGLLFNGQPGDETARAIQFCSALEQDSIERETCAKKIIFYMSQINGDAGLEVACEAIKNLGVKSEECHIVI